jgi:hypothetical protein
MDIYRFVFCSLVAFNYHIIELSHYQIAIIELSHYQIAIIELSHYQIAIIELSHYHMAPYRITISTSPKSNSRSITSFVCSRPVSETPVMVVSNKILPFFKVTG